MRVTMIFAIFIIVVNCFGNVEFELQTTLLPVDDSDEIRTLWAGSNNGDDVIYALYDGYDELHYWRIVEFDFLGDTLNVFYEELDEHLNYYLMECSMFEYEGEKYLAAAYHDVNEQLCVLKIILYQTGETVCETSFSVYYQMWDFVKQVEMIEQNGQYYIYLGIYDHSETRNGSSWCTYIKKYTFSGVSLEFVEEIDDGGYCFYTYPESEFTLSIEYNGHAYIEEPAHHHKVLYSVSHDSISVIDFIASETSNFSFRFECINYNDLHFTEYGTILWNSVTDTLTCYNSDFTEVLWEVRESAFIDVSSCISTNLGDHYIIYFSDCNINIRNRLNGFLVLDEVAPFEPEWIFRDSEEELVFFKNNETNIDVYKLAEEIVLDSNENSLIQNSNLQIQNYPNPFNPETEIVYYLAEAGNICINIYDLKGRLIRKIIDKFVEPGEHREIWDGKDDKGHIAGSGIYFVRLSSNMGVNVHKITLIK